MLPTDIQRLPRTTNLINVIKKDNTQEKTTESLKTTNFEIDYHSFAHKRLQKNNKKSHPSTVGSIEHRTTRIK